MGVLFKNNRSYSGGKLLMSPECYSTEEREVGCWTDGKPLYQKTYRDVSLVNDVDNVIDASFGTTKTLITKDVEFTGVSNTKTAFNSTVQDTLLVDNNGVLKYYIFKSGTWWNNLNSADITVWYTKTTDTAGSGIWTPLGVPAVHYSTSEHVVGTWTDGSTLYEKTMSFTPSYGTSWASYNHGISNIDTIVSIHAVLATQGTTYELPQYRSANTAIVIGANTTAIDYINSWLNDSSATITATMRYTKSST